MSKATILSVDQIDDTLTNAQLIEQRSLLEDLIGRLHASSMLASLFGGESPDAEDEINDLVERFNKVFDVIAPRIFHGNADKDSDQPPRYSIQAFDPYHTLIDIHYFGDGDEQLARDFFAAMDRDSYFAAALFDNQNEDYPWVAMEPPGLFETPPYKVTVFTLDGAFLAFSNHETLAEAQESAEAFRANPPEGAQTVRIFSQADDDWIARWYRVDPADDWSEGNPDVSQLELGDDVGRNVRIVDEETGDVLELFPIDLDDLLGDGGEVA